MQDQNQNMKALFLNSDISAHTSKSLYEYEFYYLGGFHFLVSKSQIVFVFIDTVKTIDMYLSQSFKQGKISCPH